MSHDKKPPGDTHRFIQQKPPPPPVITGAPFSATISQQVSVQSSPFPPAEELAKIEALQAGATDRILKMAEAEASHRHTVEIRIVATNHAAMRGENTVRIIAVLSAPIVAVTAIAAGVYLAITKHDSVALAAFGIIGAVFGAAYLVGIFKKQNGGKTT